MAVVLSVNAGGAGGRWALQALAENASGAARACNAPPRQGVEPGPIRPRGRPQAVAGSRSGAWGVGGGSSQLPVRAACLLFVGAWSLFAR